MIGAALSGFKGWVGKQLRKYDPWKHRSTTVAKPTSSGVSVSPDTAMTLSALFSGVRLIGETLGSLPCHTLQRVDDAARNAVDHPLSAKLLYEPNPEMTSQAFFETMQGHAVTHGNAYAEIEYSTAGRPLNLWILPPTTQPRRRPDGELYYHVPGVGGCQPENLPRWSVVHVPGMGFDGIRGYPLVYMLREVLGLGLAQQQYAAQFFGSGAQPDGILVHPKTLSDDAAKRLKKDWNKDHKGLEKSHRLAVLEEGMTYTRIATTPEEAQFLESRKFQVAEIARVIRVPPHLLYDLHGATLDNIEQQGIEFVTYSLGPWVRRWELELRRKLFNSYELGKGYYVKFQVAALLRGDLKSRYEAYNIGRNGGWLSVDEIRAFEDLAPLPNNAGKVYLQPSTMKEAGVRA
jgi:HK97 family phage portal protein